MSGCVRGGGQAGSYPVSDSGCETGFHPSSARAASLLVSGSGQWKITPTFVPHWFFGRLLARLLVCLRICKWRIVVVRAITLLGILSLPAWPENAPVSEASAPAIIGQLMPAFYNGYLYSVAPHNTLTLFARDGHCVLNLVIEGRGNGRVWVESIAVDTDGTLAIGWVDSPNAGIDIRDSLGKLVRSIDTGIYLPMHLSFGDQSLWAFGCQRDAAREWGYPAKDYQAVRKYSMDGKVIGSYLPRSLFPSGLEPSDEGWQERRIMITSNRVGIEAVSGNSRDQR